MNERRYTYQAIADILRVRIRSGQDAPGRQLPPEPDLAAELQVSRITLRKALDILEAELLVVRQKGRGTFVAGTVGGGVAAVPDRRTTRSLLYVGDTSSHYWRDVYLAFLSVAQASGWRVSTMLESRLAAAGPDLAAIRSELDDAACLVVTPEAWNRLRGLGFHALRYTVVVGGSYPMDCPEAAQIRADTVRAGWLATRHLLELGHRHIAFIGPVPMDGAYPDLAQPHLSNHAYRGYKDAMGEAGIVPDARYALSTRGEDTLEIQFLKLFDRTPERVTAVVCEADFRAAPILRALRSRGLTTPGAVSVIGINNTPWCDMLEPRLTSVSLSEDTMARLALALCQSTACAGDVLYVPPRLVCRDSTAHVPSHINAASAGNPVVQSTG